MPDPVAPVAPVEAAKPVTPTAPVAKPVEPAEVAEEYEIDGQKVLLTKTQARTRLQKAMAADKRLQEAAEKKKEVEKFWEDFEKDPEAAYRARGKDPDKLFAEHLSRKAKLELLTPEQREAAQLKQERDDAKAELAKRDSEKKAAAQVELDKRMYAAVSEQLIAAADKHGLDAGYDVLEALADIGFRAVEDGVPLTADQIVQEYMYQEREAIEKRDRKLLSKLEGKKLVEYLGKDTVAKLKAALAAMDTESLKEIPKPVKNQVAVKAHVREVKGHLSESDFDRKFMGKR